MKKALISILICFLPAIALGQGVMTPPQTSFKVVNGTVLPNAGATITVCAANTGGIPCSPALTSTVFKNTALSQPLSNPFTADSTGGYQFAALPGNYTVTETASGFVGKSYQITLTIPTSSAAGLGDPGANGIVFRNGLNSTRIAVSADVIALFSGSCTVATIIRGDGSCAAGTATFDQVGTGTNTTAAMKVGSGATFFPIGTGQIQSTSSLFPLAAQTAPQGGTINTTLAPATNGNNVIGWSQNGDSTWDTFMGIDTFCDNTTGPPCNAGGAGSAGTPIIYKRIGFNDTGVSPQAGKNSFVSINHNFGSAQVSNGNQNRALDIEGANPASDSATVYGYYSLMSEMTFNGTPTFSGSPDGDVTTGAFSIGDNHTGLISSPHNGISAARFLSQRTNSGTWGSCPAGNCLQGLLINVNNANNGAGNGTGIVGIGVQVNDIVAGTANFFGRAIHIVKPTAGGGNRLPGGNWGLYIEDLGSNTADFNQESIASASEQGKNYFDGKTFLNHIQTGGPSHAVAAPTCASTGTGTSPSCSLATGSNDSYGKMIVTAGTTPSSSGTITLTYNATYSTNATSCVMDLSNAGSGAWNARGTLIAGAQTTGSAVVNWDNNSVNLTAASTYQVNYHCGGL